MQQLRASRVLPVLSLLLMMSSAWSQGLNTGVSASPAAEGARNTSVVAVPVVLVPVGSPTPSPATTAAPNAAEFAAPEAEAPASELEAPIPEPLDTANSSAPTPAQPQLSRVDQTLPFFKGVRSCLPFNVLIAAPQRPAGGEGNVAQTINGRISIVAEPSVINATAVAVEDDVLTLSLVGEGFFSTQPIVFIVTTPPSGGEFESVTNSGSGTVVLGPGLNTSSLRIAASRVGEVHAINVTATTLSYTGSGAFGSFLTGAFDQVSINTGATGTVVLTSVTPVTVDVDLQGITTLAVSAPEGSTITGQASGLSSVQYTPTTTCALTSQSGALDVFGDRCTEVSADVVAAARDGADDPQWTCGLLVDGQLSCAGRNVTNREEVPLETTAADESQSGQTGTAAPAPEQSGNFTTPPEGFDNTTATNVGAGINGTGANSANAGGNAANTGSNATGGNAANTGGNAANTGGNAANTGGNAANVGGNTVITVPSPSPEPGVNVIGGNTAGVTNAGGAAGLTGTVEPVESGPGGRRMLKDSMLGRRLRQFTSSFSQLSFPSFPTIQPIRIPTFTSTTPTGTQTTGSFTSGPGSFSSSSTSVGGRTQTTTSVGGSPAVTSTSYYNPVYLPGDSGSAGTAAPSPSPKPGTPTPSPAPQSSVSVTLGGNTTSGVAVVNTQCAVNGSLPMLSVDGAGSWVDANGGLGSDAVNSTGGGDVAEGNTTTGGNADNTGGSTSGNPANTGGSTGGNAANTGGNTATGGIAANTGGSTSTTGRNAANTGATTATGGNAANAGGNATNAGNTTVGGLVNDAATGGNAANAGA